MQDLLFETRDGVTRITLNRPQAMNAMQSRNWAEIADMLRDIEHDSDVRCVLLSGAGGNFCAGGDVKEFSTTIAMTPKQRARFWMQSADQNNALFLMIERIPQPVVVSVRGVAAGGGLSLVAAADLAIASDNSRFIAAQIKIGAIPDSAASYNLVQSIGIKRAKQYGFLGDVMDAQTALDAGLINWLVPDADLQSETDNLLSRLKAMPRVALQRTKNAINVAHRVSLADHVVQEALDVGACVSEEDYVRNVQAFIDKRRK
jgi:2-(1,2-epoxy-1,2-dihydrophenyl)acetyl-CoA isomerase